MSSYCRKYKIVYDGNDGMTYSDFIYYKFIGVSSCEMWVNEDGSPVDFGFVTDSHAYVKAMCIIGIETEHKYFYWKEIKEFDLPEKVAKAFNYVYPQHIKN